MTDEEIKVLHRIANSLAVLETCLKKTNGNGNGENGHNKLIWALIAGLWALLLWTGGQVYFSMDKAILRLTESHNETWRQQYDMKIIINEANWKILLLQKQVERMEHKK